MASIIVGECCNMHGIIFFGGEHLAGFSILFTIHRHIVGHLSARHIPAKASNDVQHEWVETELKPVIEAAKHKLISVLFGRPNVYYNKRIVYFLRDQFQFHISFIFVSTIGSPSVTTIVCSCWAIKPPLSPTIVQPSCKVSA